ncbi:MAG: NAD(P)H-dependent oxidoreductase [Pseudomonadota bacterium]
MTLLAIHASGRHDGSLSRTLTAELIDHLADDTVVERDVAPGLPVVDDAWIAANFTPEEDRTAEQRHTLALSDTLVAELEAADTLIIGTPIYNFGIPAALKAWIDLIARARKTFRYTENGPVGLLQGKRAFIVVTSGGTPIDAEIDFATPYLRHALAFIGITDVTVIPADRLMADADGALARARRAIAGVAA